MLLLSKSMLKVKLLAPKSSVEELVRALVHALVLLTLPLLVFSDPFSPLMIEDPSLVRVA
jgi:hypothetical protein